MVMALPMSVSWEQLVQYAHLQRVPRITFTRKPQVMSAYRAQNDELRRMGMTIERKIVEENPGLEDWIVFQANKFPYDLQPGIVHLLAWLPPKLDDTRSQHCIDRYVSDILEYRLRTMVVPEDSVNFVVFENPIEHRSVKGLRHLHIFHKV